MRKLIDELIVDLATAVLVGGMILTMFWLYTNIPVWVMWK